MECHLSNVLFEPLLKSLLLRLSVLNYIMLSILKDFWLIGNWFVYDLKLWTEFCLPEFLYCSPNLQTEKARATHSSTLAWKIPWMEEPGRLQSMGSRSRTRLSDFTFTFHFHALEKEMATHSSVLAWRSPGTGDPGGLPSMGLHWVGHDWSDLAGAATCNP